MPVAHPLRIAIARLGRDRAGVTAVEFAVIGPIFLVLIAAILETALVFFAGQTFDTAVNNSIRLVRTGQVQAEGMSADGFRAEVCAGLYGMFDCDAVRIVMRPVPRFSAFIPSRPVDPTSGAWTVEDRFEPGIGSSVVVIEAYYKFPALFAIPGLSAGLLPDHTRLLATSRIFMTEPFE